MEMDSWERWSTKNSKLRCFAVALIRSGSGTSMTLLCPNVGGVLSEPSSPYCELRLVPMLSNWTFLSRSSLLLDAGQCDLLWSFGDWCEILVGLVDAGPSSFPCLEKLGESFKAVPEA